MKIVLIFVFLGCQFFVLNSAQASFSICQMFNTKWSGQCTTDKRTYHDEILFIDWVEEKCLGIEMYTKTQTISKIDRYEFNDHTSIWSVDDEILKTVTQTTDRWLNSDNSSFQRLKLEKVTNLVSGQTLQDVRIKTVFESLASKNLKKTTIQTETTGRLETEICDYTLVENY